MSARIVVLMQTFLPYPEFARTAGCLDMRRLGQQRVEALQVLRGLTVRGTAGVIIRPCVGGPGTRRRWSATV